MYVPTRTAALGRAAIAATALSASAPRSRPAEILKSFGRRRRAKVLDERTRDQQALDAENGSAVAAGCLADSFVAALARGAAVCRAAMMAEEER
jgi:hypothetical protein